MAKEVPGIKFQVPGEIQNLKKAGFRHALE
jgi:hypothetical protein